ncbi:hypothetical protein Y032_0044g1008 [Ancylostoma ceylanicum]|nr:hypothetical protein Y032_0044g1008 [Ancylostoma ceylanicum]
MKLLPLFLAISFGSFHRITEKENEERKHQCGLTFLNTRAKYKSFGGRRVKPDEYPWLARLVYYEKLPHGYLRPHTCSGVLISQRHVMTAAHCVSDRDECGNVENRELDQIYIYFGSYCAHYRTCKNPHFAANITKKNYKNPSDVANDLAIMELRDIVSPRDALPICLPQKDTILAKSLKLAGSGVDTTLKGNLHANGNQVVDLPLREDYKKPGEIGTRGPNSSACNGDSGGPLFQVNKDNKNVLVGITSTATSCTQVLSVRSVYFADIRDNLEWICGETGACQ